MFAQCCWRILAIVSDPAGGDADGKCVRIDFAKTGIRNINLCCFAARNNAHVHKQQLLFIERYRPYTRQWIRNCCVVLYTLFVHIYITYVCSVESALVRERRLQDGRDIVVVVVATSSSSQSPSPYSSSICAHTIAIACAQQSSDDSNKTNAQPLSPAATAYHSPAAAFAIINQRTTSDLTFRTCRTCKR